VLIAVTAFMLFPVSVFAAPVTVAARLHQQEVFLGESFLYEVRVSGGKQVSDPDVSGFRDFDIEPVPRSWVDMGKDNRLEPEELTVFFYQMMALDIGNLTIPGAEIRVDGKTYTAPALKVTVRAPTPSDEYKLDVSLSHAQVYVGEPVEFTAVWYYLEEFLFYNANIPLFRHPDFTFKEKEDISGGTARLLVSSSTGSHIILGDRGTAYLDGKRFLTATYRQMIVPRKAGYYDFLPSTVEVWSKADTDRSEDDQGYSSKVIGSRRLRLQVLPLPARGQPDGFTGIVTRSLQMETSLSTTTMNVGDPVTLSISVSGPPNLEDVRLPPLDTLPALAADFSIHPGPMDVRMEESSKEFTQTIRAKNENVREVPAVKVFYFDPESGSYETAASDPIDITVLATQLVTSDDLESGDILGMGGTGLRENEDGIRYNYSTVRMIARARPGLKLLITRPVLLLLLIGPASLLVVAAAYARRTRMIHERTHPNLDPGQQERDRRKRRFSSLIEKLERGEHVDMAESLRVWREYVGSGLHLSSGRLTVSDIESTLRRRGADQRLIREVRDLLGRYELNAYQSKRGRRKKPAEPGGSDREVVSRMIATARDLERYF
jgi:hypothetical protein